MLTSPRSLTAAAVLLATAVAGTLSAGAPHAAADDDGAAARAADRYGVAEAALETRLAADPNLRVTPEGVAFYIDPAPTGAPAATDRFVAEAFPLDQTFKLHSKPNSQRTIYLDVNGQNVSNTHWNTSYGVPNGNHPALDLAGNGPGFSNSELLDIQEIWQRVAEDYAPFDVDVTTEEPAAGEIDRTGAADQVYGTRALITPSTSAATNICGGGCGGVAFIGVFNWFSASDPHARYQPAWVFPQLLSNDVKNIAEATTHEVGHNLGLDHDGTTTQNYYAGHNGWAPIMGVGYDEPIVQFALNDYPNADLGGPGPGSLQSNADDIVTITQFGANLRTDEPGTSVANAGAVPAKGYIRNRTDVDYFALGTCAVPPVVTANPAPVSPNLDIDLRLLDASSTVLDADNPTSARVNRDVASGLGAQVSFGAAGGPYYVRVDGVGRGTATNGYTDYGSIGAYTLDVTCAAQAKPGKPRIGEATPGRQGGRLTAKIRWQPPLATATPAIDGYRVIAYRRNSDGRYVKVLTSPLFDEDTRSAIFSTDRPGKYKFAVRAHNAIGNGPLSAKSNAVRPR
jgi:hypothetical protein